MRIYIYTYVYTFICTCVCVCVCVGTRRTNTKPQLNPNARTFSSYLRSGSTSARAAGPVGITIIVSKLLLTIIVSKSLFTITVSKLLCICIGNYLFRCTTARAAGPVGSSGCTV